jgi:hypothetical protein
MLFGCSEDSDENSITLPEKDQYDFFPLNLGNLWEYNFDYRPSQSSYIWQKGTVKWQIYSVDLINSSIYFLVKETINATIINKENPDGNIDTSYITNQNKYFDLVQNQDGFILFPVSNFFGRRILLKRFYETEESIIILDSGPEWSQHHHENLISLDTEFHNITLLKNIGIDSWLIDTHHNGGPKGSLVLINYKIN